eukprot:CCRYP_006721-RA/>CCRYP_006721-RA protein AED:0.09 eAED:0.06 QI:0/1/0.5/1/1/1/2/84/471
MKLIRRVSCLFHRGTWNTVRHCSKIPTSRFISTMSSLTIYLSLTSSPSTPRIPLTLPLNTSSSQLRALAAAATNIPLATMKLIFRGRMIPDKPEGDVATEFKLEEECVIHVMGKPVVVDDHSAQQQQQQQPSAPAAAGASVTIPPTTPPSVATTPTTLTAALATLRSTNPPATYHTALSTASKLLNNIIQHPMEEKYRSVKQSNAAFHKRLGGVNGGQALLLAAGFVMEDGVFVLRPSQEAWPKLVEAGEVVGRALREVEANSAPPVVGAGTTSGWGAAPSSSVGGLPNLDSMGGPGMEATMQNMLSNPEMLQNMMHNPMVQQMMRNDPRFANNPMLQQSLDALSSNPDMIRQFSQMMGDPGVRANVSRMMQQQQQQQQQAGGNAAGADPFGTGPEAMRRQMEQFQQMSRQFGGMSGGFGASSAQGAPSGRQGSGVAANHNSSNVNGGGDDSQMTEEEMIAEAIARSLRET